MQIFNSIGSSASNAISNPDNNNVGYAVDQMNQDAPINERLANVLSKGLSGAGRQQSNNAVAETLGSSFYQSPIYLAGHLTQLGQFFTHATPGNFYTNRYDPPQKEKPAQSTDPIEFNNKFYQRMRAFAQGEEIANTGQPRIRSR